VHRKNETLDKPMKQKHPSLAKITRPSLTGIYPVERLFRLLDQGRKRQVIWITGPPGSGKTTLVSSYLDARKLKNIWYQCDEGDEDIATFFYYMRLAAKRAAPRRRKPLPLFTPEYLKGISTFTRRYFENLYSRLKPPFAVVLDSYQEVQANSMFHEVMRVALSEIPEGGSVILISRTNPLPSMASLRVSPGMEVLGWDELQLTVEESSGIALLRGEKRLSEETIRQLHDRTQGWMAGLVLLLEQAETEGLMSDSPTEFTPGVIFDYFAGEIFQKTNKKTQDFLLKTAFLPRMTVRMAEELTGQSRAGRILSDLNHRQYFTQKHGHSEPSYQYHPLFREFLLARARDSITPKQRTELKRTAAALLEESGQAEDAASLYREARDWKGLARLICTHAPSLMAQGRGRALEEWLKDFPEEVLKNTPWLVYWFGVCYIPFNPPEGLIRFEEAFKLFKSQKDPAGIYLSWSGVMDSIFLEGEDFEKMDPWIALLDRSMKEYPFPSVEIESRVAYSMLTYISVRRPSHPNPSLWLERAFALLQRISDPNFRIQIISFLVVCYDMIGEPAKGEVVFDVVRESMMSPEATPLTVIMGKMIECGYQWRKGMFEQSLEAVSEGLDLGQTTGIHIADYMLVGGGTACALSMADLALTVEFLRRMSPVLSGGTRMDAGLYHYLTSWHAMLVGDSPRAYEQAKAALELTVKLGYTYAEGMCHFGMAQVMHERSEHRKAVSHLSKARRIGRQMKSRLFKYIHLLAEAQFALDAGKERAALTALKKAMALGSKGGYVNFPYRRPDVMACLCAKALEAGIEADYVKYLIRKGNLFTDSPPLDIEEWPWPIKIYTLGRFSLVRHGKPVRFIGKARQKPLEMLKALISLGGRKVSEDQLSDALWPEADGDAAHQALATTLHRLRQLLGIEKAVKRSEGCITLEPRYCWVDIWGFERILGQIDIALSEGQADTAKDELTRLADKALKFYQGPFLSSDIGQPWTISRRERLRSRVLRTIRNLGNYLCEARECEQAVACYQKGLEMDNLCEDFYRRLMKCNECLGRITEAIEVYNRCKKVFSANLGVEPSAETVAVYKALRAGRVKRERVNK